MMTNPYPAIEKRHWRTIRLIIGILMVVETALLFLGSVFFAMFMFFMGGMAFLAGGGAATDAHVAEAWQMIWLMAITPLLWPVLHAIASINILRRKRPMLVTILCTLTAMAQIGLLSGIYQLYPEKFKSLIRFNAFTIFIALWMLIPLAGVIVSFQMRPRKIS